MPVQAADALQLEVKTAEKARDVAEKEKGELLREKQKLWDGGGMGR